MEISHSSRMGTNVWKKTAGLGSVYTSLFIVTLGGAGYKSSLTSLEKSINDKLITDLIVQPFHFHRLRPLQVLLQQVLP